ncbi:MAG TPA: hypothetical protein VLX28_15265 [Thermoanaerobaculia bacterium]|nr:hypothetical protein [Thermoanaerobaculia bacterium]
MRKTLPLCTALLLGFAGFLAAGAAMAQAAPSLPADLTAPQPQAAEADTTPLLQQLQAAVDSPLQGAQPRAALCSPQTIFFCVNESCQCSRFICAHCGVKSFTCDENTHQFSCVCKTC